MAYRKLYLTIPVPTYRTHVNVFMSGNKQELINRQTEIAKAMGVADDLQFEARGRAYAIYINEDGFRCADIIIDSKELSFGVIAHEVFHCVSYIMSYVDIVLCPESEEAFTCLTEYITESIYRAMNSKI